MKDLDANALIVFHHIVKAGSLSRAAQDLNLSRSALSHRIKTMETQLGCALLVRSTRSIGLTEAGYRLAEHAERMAGALKEASLLAKGLNDDTAGTIRISAPAGLAQVWLQPLVLSYMQANPRVTVELNLNEQRANLMTDPIDLAIRVTASPPENLVAKKLFDVSWSLCASAGFAHQHARAIDMDELACLPLAAFGRQGTFKPIDIDRGTNRIAMLDKAGLISNDLGVVREAVRRGLAMAALPDYFIRGDMASGRLTRLLPECVVNTGLGKQAFTLHLPAKMLPRRVKRLLEYLHQSC